jgi:hypothetical protein
MRRASILAALTVLVAMAADASAAGTPVLAGPWSSYQRGYGHARPSTIFNGGDGSGLVTHMRWQSWGGPMAVGSGLGLYVAPHQSNAEGTRETAKIVVFQLGYCRGRRAYEAIEWYFPQHGQHFNPHEYIEACTGEYHSG